MRNTRINRSVSLIVCLLLVILAITVAASPSLAIPVTSATQTTQETNPNQESSNDWDLDWSYAYKFRGSSSAAIASHWILTAAHVADDSASGIITIGGTTYTPQETRYYDGTSSGSTNPNDATRDLALVRFDNAFPGYYNYATGTSYVHDDVILVGYGYDGTVTQSATSGSWTQGSDRDKRWGTNNIDSLVSVPAGYGAYAHFVMSISGTNGPRNTPYETGLNVYDSGGPLFVNDNGEWIVAGINVARSGSPYNTTYSVPIGNYDTWITDVVPEPATLSLLVLGGLMTLLRRRRKAS